MSWAEETAASTAVRGRTVCVCVGGEAMRSARIGGSLQQQSHQEDLSAVGAQASLLSPPPPIRISNGAEGY